MTFIGVNNWDDYWRDVSHHENKWMLYSRIAGVVAQEAKEKSIVVLDMGCGVGGLMHRLKNIPKVTAVGIEKSQLAASVCKVQNLLVIESDMVNPYVHGEIDVIVSVDSLDCVPDPDKVVNKWLSLLKDGGILVVALTEEGSVHGKYHRESLWGADAVRLVGTMECDTIIPIKNDDNRTLLVVRK